MLIRAVRTFEIRVYDGVTRLDAHGDTRWSKGAIACDQVICVSFNPACAVKAPPKPDQASDNGVHGYVRHADGTAISGLKVKLRSVGISGEDDIWEDPATTDSFGWYVQAWTPGSGVHDVVVRVYNLVGAEYVLVGSSDVVYTASSPRIR